MKQKPKLSLVEQFLTEPPVRVQRCVTCANKVIVDAIAEFAAAREAQRTAASWATFHKRVLCEKLAYQFGYTTLLNHVRKCVGRGNAP